MSDDVWLETTVGDFIEEHGGEIKTGPFGTKLKASEYTEEGVPVISVGEVGYGELVLHDKTPNVDESITDRMPEYVLHEGDIVFGRKGAVERSAIVREHQAGWFLGSDGIRLRLPKSCSRRFIAYQFQSQEHKNWMMQQALGSTMPSLNQKIIARIPIVVPPLPEQRAIASILGALDDKIELNRRMNATLESLARAIFKSWFVDFDPVRINASKGNAGQMPASSHDPKVLDLFPSTFQDSEIGPIPEGWRIDTLGDHVELQRGKTYKSKLKGTPGPYLLGLGSIERNGGFRPDKLVTYGGDSPENLLVYPGDLYVSLKDVTQSADLLGSVARVPRSIKVGRMTQDTVKLVLNETAPSLNIVYRTLLTPAYREHCRSHATGTTNLGLAREDFLSYPLIVPPKEIESAYDEAMSRIEGQIDANDRESTSLGKSRDIMLPKLLSRELPINPSPEN